jgi:menaquinone-dependent protoporphyrinogen oxidase
MSTCRNILIAFGTRAGSTAEIAEFIAARFRERGASVDVLPIEQVTDIKPYCAAIIGTATRIGKPLDTVARFVKKHARDLEPMALVYFVVGVTMREDTPEHRAQAHAVLDPLRLVKEPLREGLFAGKVEYAKIEQPWRFLVSHDKEGEMREGDWRDWDAIRAWVDEISPTIMGIAALPCETV